jgi:hypothetical protein
MVTVHAHPGLVAVRAGKPDAAGRREFSSGLLITPRLLLTARHGVIAHRVPGPANGAVLPGIEVAFAAGPRGAVRLTGPVPGTVAWLGAGGLDAALIELPEATEFTVPDRFLTAGLIWGEPVGTQPVRVTVTGMPGFAAEATGEPTEVVTARGQLDPGTYTASDRYAIDLDAWPEGWKEWQGVSGSAVISTDGGCLTGVVAWSDKVYGGRRLTAVPIRALLSDPGFLAILERHQDSIPDIEPVELMPLLSRPRPAASIGALLRPDAGLTDFTGREAELAELENWRDEPAAAGPDVRMLLITGRGGEGKTRLALEFLARSKQDGWTGGMLQQSASSETPEAVKSPGTPLLLIIDYAATRWSETAALAQAIARARPRVPVRLLLLARTDGEWWPDLAYTLAEDLPDLAEGDPPVRRALLRPLKPLLGRDSSMTSSAMMFAATATRLAPELTRFTGRLPAELREIATHMTAGPPDTARSGHVLTVQMAALAALLNAAVPPAVEAEDSGSIANIPAEPAAPSIGATERVEDTLLRHEREYRNRLATQHGLEDLRLVRDRAVAGAALFGARGPGEPDRRDAACAIVGAALPELNGRVSRQREVAAWIAGIYPPDTGEPSGESEYWGRVLPDRLGEFLALRLLSQEETARGAGQGLLASLAGQSDPTGTARALLILSRASDHDQRATAWIECLVMAQPALAGSAAIRVASYAENPAPLRSALIQLGRHDRDLLIEVVGGIHDTLPRFSLEALESSSSLAHELVIIMTDLAKSDRTTWLPQLAVVLSTYAVRLVENGHPAAALAASEQALDARLELAARDPNTYLAGLAASLNNHAALLAENGQREQALAISAQALDAYQELAASDPDAYLPHLATSLSNHTLRLAENGQHQEALAISIRGLDASRELAKLSPEIYLPHLATSLSNHAVQLAENGRPERALAVSAQALATRRELAALNRDVHLPQFAMSLNNHANRLAAAGQREQGLFVSAQAVDAYHELAAHNPDAYLPQLAAALNNQAARLDENGQPEQALLVSAQAVDACRELAARNPDAYLPQLAAALNNRAIYLAMNDQSEQSLVVSAESLDSYRGLVARNRDAHLPDLAMSLANHAARLDEIGEHERALAISAQAVNTYRELATRNRDAYLPGLTRSLTVHAIALLLSGKIDDVVSVSVEAIQSASELPDLTRITLEPAIGSVLQEAHRTDPRRAEASFRKAAGKRFPKQWKQGS